MYLEIQQRIRAKFVQAVKEAFALDVAEPGIDFPPSAEMGDLSITACFELAKQLRQPPRKIAEQLTTRLLPIDGVTRVSIAGPGYINCFLDRAKLAAGLFELRTNPSEPGALSQGKILVEAAMYDTELHLTAIRPGHTPCLACLYPDKSTDWKRQFPVFGAVAGTVGCMAAMEAIKVITGIGTPLYGEMLVGDLATGSFRKLRLRRDPQCLVCAH